SSAVRSSLTSLQNTADLLATTQERLATGNRVNSALDDPTAFFTATALNDRASDLSTLLDEQGQAIQVIQAADDGISAIQDLVSTARAIANQALQTDSLTERATLAAQYDAILGQIEDLAADASFNGTNLLDSVNSQDLQVVFNEDGSSTLTVAGVNFTDTTDVNGLNLQRVSTAGTPAVPAVPAVASTGSVAFSGLTTSGTLAIDSDGAGTTAGFSVNLSTLGTPAVAATPGSTETTGFDFANVSNGDSITINSGSGSPLTITFGTGGGANEIDATTLTNEGDLIAAVQGLANTAFGSGVVTVGAGTGTELSLSSTAGNVSFAFDDANNAGTAATASGTSTNFNAGSAAVPPTIDQVVTAINAAASGTGLTATNDGSGNIAFSSTDGNFTVSGAGLSGTTTGTGFNAGAAAIPAVPAGGLATNEAINDTLAAIDAALGTLRTTAATLGTNLSTIQIRSDFTANLINTLEVGAGNLTLADLNEEGANLLTLQTRQQLASTSLSFATQADQAVLSLFG
ncbi:MAG: ABC transporter substrate-binding protein, partial [Rhizobiales bacterium]|nr:ABC transporter substrate-binding protein [Hyphomicrobiales bacterium]